jgi:DNA-binding NarL/FixJ family response regulator
LFHADLISAIHRLSEDLIIISISANPEVHQQVLSLGADLFVSKIDSPHMLIEALRECEKRLINGEIASSKLDM